MYPDLRKARSIAQGRRLGSRLVRRAWQIPIPAALLFLVACGGGPAGVDSDLTDDWGGLAEAAGFEPEVGACHQQQFSATAPLAEYQPVGCDQPHLSETVYVGTFTGRAAERDTAPAPDSGAHRSAYRECEQRTGEYLGAGFRHGRLWLGVSVPSEAGWAGGARWYRCDLLEVESIYGDPVERTGSLAGALAADDSRLRLGCYAVEVDGEDVQEMSPVACDQEHQAEFVGVWRPDGSAYPESGDAAEAVYQGCRERVARYVDLPVDEELQFRTGAIADWMSEADWRAGDRAFRCYLWLPGSDLTESLAGDGTDALPVQTE
jgi:hypothetical protein